MFCEHNFAKAPPLDLKVFTVRIGCSSNRHRQLLTCVLEAGGKCAANDDLEIAAFPIPPGELIILLQYEFLQLLPE
jgi:hypothetical protein